MKQRFLLFTVLLALLAVPAWALTEISTCGTEYTTDDETYQLTQDITCPPAKSPRSPEGVSGVLKTPHPNASKRVGACFRPATGGGILELGWGRRRGPLVGSSRAWRSGG